MLSQEVQRPGSLFQVVELCPLLVPCVLLGLDAILQINPDVYKRQVLHNAPSLGELEAKAKAGEQISLTDLAAAVNAAEKAPKAKKSHTAKPKKPSIRAQLDAAKKEQSKQTPPREKTKELEV